MMLNSGVDLNRIRLFLEIVRLGSITKTAEILNFQKSKVSRDLALLEQELGVQLIHRTTRQFSLTIEGQRFYESASASIQTLNDAIGEVSGETKSIAGHISITCPEDIGEIILIPLLEEFSRLYPKVTYSIDFSTDIKDLIAHKVDMAIRPGRLKDSSLKMKKAGQIEFGLFCSNSIYESAPEIKSPIQISNFPTVYFKRNLKKPQWELHKNGKKTLVAITPTVQVNSYVAAFKLIQKGMGIGLLPKFIVNSDNAKSTVVQILKEFETVVYDVQIIYPQRNEELARVRVLSDFLSKRMRTLL